MKLCPKCKKKMKSVASGMGHQGYLCENPECYFYGILRKIRDDKGDLYY